MACCRSRSWCSRSPRRSCHGARAQQEARSASPADGQTSTLLSDGSVVLIGGEAQPTTVAVYDPTTKTTRVVGSLRDARRRHTATVLPDGSVLIAGGVGADGQIVADAERFDPVSGELTTVASPTFTARSGHTATVLSDGRVLFTGGDTPGGGGARAELWDAATNATEAVSVPPSSERVGGSAQLLPDGRIRVFGGVERRSRTAPADEVFDPLTSSFVASERATTERLRPAVVAVLPADRATDVATTTRISLRFSEPIDARTVAAELSSDASGTLRADSRHPARRRRRHAAVSHAGGGAASRCRVRRDLPRGPHAVWRHAARLLLDASETEKPSSSTPDDAAAGDADPDAPPVAGRSGLDSPWRKLPPLKAGAGVTALAGQVLLLNGRPLPDVTLEIGERRVQTDRTGRFLLRLGTQPSGWKELVIDGATANRGRRKYGPLRSRGADRRQEERGVALHDLDAGARHEERGADYVADSEGDGDHDAAHSRPRVASAAAHDDHRSRRASRFAKSASRRFPSSSHRSRCRPGSRCRCTSPCSLVGRTCRSSRTGTGARARGSSIRTINNQIRSGPSNSSGTTTRRRRAGTSTAWGKLGPIPRR